MGRLFCVRFAILVLVWVLVGFTEPVGAQSKDLSAKPSNLQVIFESGTEPYVVDHARSGIAVELTREVFLRAGLPFDDLYATKQRMVALLESGVVDVVVGLQPEDSRHHYSQPFLRRSVKLFSLTSRLTPPQQWSELAGQSLCAHNADQSLLGAEFRAQKPSFKPLYEGSDRLPLVNLWLQKKCQILVMDPTELLWFWTKAEMESKGLSTVSLATTSAVAPPNASEHVLYVRFNRADIRDIFDRTLLLLRRDGSYDRIRNQFVTQFFQKKPKP